MSRERMLRAYLDAWSRTAVARRAHFDTAPGIPWYWNNNVALRGAR